MPYKAKHQPLSKLVRKYMDLRKEVERREEEYQLLLAEKTGPVLAVDDFRAEPDEYSRHYWLLPGAGSRLRWHCRRGEYEWYQHQTGPKGVWYIAAGYSKPAEMEAWVERFDAWIVENAEMIERSAKAVQAVRRQKDNVFYMLRKHPHAKDLRACMLAYEDEREIAQLVLRELTRAVRESKKTSKGTELR